MESLKIMEPPCPECGQPYVPQKDRGRAMVSADLADGPFEQNAIYESRQAAVVAGEEQVRSPVIRASEHLSSERRRGLEIAEARDAAWRIRYAPAPYPASSLERDARLVAKAFIRSLSPSSEGGEEKTSHPPAVASGGSRRE